MENLKTAKQKLEFFETNTPEEFIVQAGIDTTLTDRFLEMMRSLQWLHNQARHFRGGGQEKISYRNVTGMLKSVTKYAFITSGLPYIQKGLKEILNLGSQEEMASELRRFEVIVRLVCIRKVKYATITDDMIAEHVRMIQVAVEAGRATYDENDWTLVIKNYGVAGHCE